MKKSSTNRIQRTLTLDEALDVELREFAQAISKPISYVVEDALELYLRRNEKNGGK